MLGIVKKIQTAVRNRTTYRAGLLQAKAFRILKVHTGAGLAEYGLSTIDWALLGLLYDSKEGMRSSGLAEELGVEAPFVTALITKLKKMEFVNSKTDKNDTRAKNIFLTSKGNSFVSELEVRLRDHMRPLIEGIDKRDLAAYLMVLEKLIHNSARQAQK